MDAAALAISAVYAKNTAVERDRAAREIAAFNEREYRGIGIFLALHLEKSNDREINEWYEDQDEAYEEELDRERNKCQLEEACVQLTAWAPSYEFDIQSLLLLGARDRVLSIDTYNEFKAQDAARTKLEKAH